MKFLELRKVVCIGLFLILTGLGIADVPTLAPPRDNNNPLSVWLEQDQGVIKSGNNVLSWNSPTQSGTLTQIWPSFRPAGTGILKLVAHTLAFNGRYLSQSGTSAISYAQPGALFVVAQPNGLRGELFQAGPWTLSFGGSGTNGKLIFSPSPSAAASGSTAMLQFGKKSAFNIFELSRIADGLATSGSIQPCHLGVSGSTQAISVGLVQTGSSNHPILIGKGFVGHISEVVYYSAAISGSTRDLVIRYLANKYQIPVAGGIAPEAISWTTSLNENNVLTSDFQGAYINPSNVSYKLVEDQNAGNGSLVDSGTLTTVDQQLVTVSNAGTLITANGGYVVDKGTQFVYTPAKGFTGTDRFDFVATDGISVSQVATISINVQPYVNAPVAVSGTAIGFRNMQVSGALAAINPDGRALTFALTGAVSSHHGVVTLSDTQAGIFSYVPSQNFTGTDSFGFIVSDPLKTSGVGTMTVIVKPYGQITALSGNAIVKTGSSVRISLQAVDNTGIKGALRFAVTQPAHGAVALAGADCIYTPEPNYAGADSFTFTASKGGYTSNSASIKVSVEGLAINSISVNPIATGSGSGMYHFSASIVESDTSEMISTYAWALVGTSTNVSILSPNASETNVKIKTAGIYNFSLTVSGSATCTRNFIVNVPATTGRTTNTSNIYWRRGSSDDVSSDTPDWNFDPYIVAINFQKGVTLEPLGDNSDLFNPTPWFMQIAKNTAYQVSYDTAKKPVYSSTDAFENPVVAFGSAAGGSPLYANQSYTFGVGGGQDPSRVNLPDIRITAYEKTAFSAGAMGVSGTSRTYSLPRPSQQNWAQLAANNFVYDLKSDDLGISTKVQFTGDGLGLLEEEWPEIFGFQGLPSPLLITHVCTNPDRCYKVEFITAGESGSSTAIYPLAVRPPSGNTDESTASSRATYANSYVLNFDRRLPWQSTFIDQPQFQGVPVPSEYAGMNLDELINQSPREVQDSFQTPSTEQASALLALDGTSPELWRHPVLDDFVKAMKYDPIQLANYVLNEIEIRDAFGMDFRFGSPSLLASGGVRRGALATFLEGQGSPTEQCALLVYLLRSCGIPSGYVFPAMNQTEVLEGQMSRILRIQLSGTTTGGGDSIPDTPNTPRLTYTNFPWVAAYINGQWVHIFPWIKDTVIQEGVNLYDYLPNPYKSAAAWTDAYLRNGSDVRITNTDDPADLFPAFVQNNLKLTHPDVSIADIGMVAYDRKNYFTKWEDFPRPWKAIASGTLPISDLAQIPNIFDTIQITVTNTTAGANGVILTSGSIRALELHNHRVLIYAKHARRTAADANNQVTVLGRDASPFGDDEVTTTLALVREPFGGDSAVQKLSGKVAPHTPNLNNTDSSFAVDFSYAHSGVVTDGSGSAPRILTSSDPRQFFRDDMVALCFNFGRVTPAMLNCQVSQYRNAQKTLLGSQLADVNMAYSDLSALWSDLDRSMGQTKQDAYDLNNYLNDSYQHAEQNDKNDAKDVYHRVIGDLNVPALVGVIETVAKQFTGGVPGRAAGDPAVNVSKDSAALWRCRGRICRQLDSLCQALVTEIAEFNYLDGEVTKDEAKAKSNEAYQDIVSQMRAARAKAYKAMADLAALLNRVRSELFTATSDLDNIEESAGEDVTQGIPSYLVGMSYYKRLSDFDRYLCNLSKRTELSLMASGLSLVAAGNKGAVPSTIGRLGLDDGSYGAKSTWQKERCYVENSARVLPHIDMHYLDATLLSGTEALHPDSGLTMLDNYWDFTPIFAAEGSAEEHEILNEFYNINSSVSTVKLLHIAEAKAGGLGSGTGIFILNSKSDLASIGNTECFSKGTWKTLESWMGAGEWNQITWYLTGAPGHDYTNVYVPIGPQQSATGSFRGCGAFIMSVDGCAAWIGNNENGGYAAVLPAQALDTSNFNGTLLKQGSDGVPSITFGSASPGSVAAPASSSPGDYNSVYDNIASGNWRVTSTEAASINEGQDQTGGGNISNNSSTQQVADAARAQADAGNAGLSSYYGNILGKLGKVIFDRVDSTTGEFYVDSEDLVLNGPMRLEVRRNYGSLNLADNNFGYGWKMSCFPYLVLSHDGKTIHAAEMDGSVVVYSQTMSGTCWSPLAANNPSLANQAGDAAGSVSNLFNNRIVRTGSNTYLLTGADGSVRTFVVEAFPTAGAHGLLRRRPYLSQWTDNRGNYLVFSFGNDPTANDYGQVNRIDSNNGNGVAFQYDPNGQIVEAFSMDGRHVYYDYDDYGDLVKVRRPDGSEIDYDYQHTMQRLLGVNGSALDSTHLLIRETKPEGRIVENDYDGSRRVTQQRATVGADKVPHTNATFAYATTRNPIDGTITGATLITDVFGNQTRYDYVNGQVTKITDPLGQTITQTWYQPGDVTRGAYQRSLASRTDKRGLRTDYLYDSNGNVIERIETGDLKGTGAVVTATTSYGYNALNLVTSVTDANGNASSYTYGTESGRQYLPVYVEKRASTGELITSSSMTYEDVVVSGTAAYGILKESVVGSGPTDQVVTVYTNDARGFVTGKSIGPDADHPTRSFSYVYNDRGEMVEESEPLSDNQSNSTSYAYDGLGHPTWTERRDASGTVVDWKYNYYNQNGEVEWTQGARYNPVDYVYHEYDGAGRLTQTIKWRSEAAPDGSGMQAPAGDAQFATAFNVYDMFGNLLEARDPLHNSTTMQYDAIGQMTSRQVHQGDANGPVVSSESFQYEPGGEVSQYVSALGGTTTKLYTSRGQIKEQDNPDGTTLKWEYDLGGRVLKEFYPNGSFKQTGYLDGVRTVTQTLFTSGSTVLTTGSSVSDGRGNVISKTDAEGYTVQTTYDALNRILTVTGPGAGANSAQQLTTYSYDDAHMTETVANALGEWTATVSDALGRPVNIMVGDTNGTVQQTAFAYSADHQSVTKTIGTGAAAISGTTYTDNDGHTALVRNADNTFSWWQYDANGNLLSTRTPSHDGQGVIATFQYDALNRVIAQRTPSATGLDGALTAVTYQMPGNGNAAETVKRNMPGGTVEVVNYDNAGRKISEELEATGTTTRHFDYTYYPAAANDSGAFPGKLWQADDPRQFTKTTTYDALGRVTTVISAGSAVPEQNGTTSYAYDRRGLVTEVDQVFALASTGPSTKVTGTYDGFGQKMGESVFIDGTAQAQWTQSWNGAGRRTALASALMPEASFAFGYRADGLMTSGSSFGNAFTYNYADNGLPTGESNPWRTMAVVNRDTRGRILNQTNTVGGSVALDESATWRDDSKLASYTALRNGSATWNDGRPFTYNDRGQLLAEPNVTGTLSYQFDNDPNGTGMGPGVRTMAQVLGSGTLDVSSTNAFLQVTPEQWVSPAISSSDNVVWSYDGLGSVTSGSSTLVSGSTQKFTWDAFGRLLRVERPDLLWTAIYDGLGRRIRVTEQPCSAGVAAGSARTIDSYYDPQVEFLEVGVSVGGTNTWKVYGPDLNGAYGGLQGIGGLQATVDVSAAGTAITPVLNDRFGNVVATISATLSGTTTNWSPAQVGSYGVLSSSTAPLFGNLATLAQSSLWRGHRMDATGFYYMGARYYDPQGGRFLSADPLGNVSSISLYDYASGDPVNGLDPDGRFGKNAANEAAVDWGAVKGFNQQLQTSPELYDLGGAFYGAGTTIDSLATQTVEHPLDTAVSLATAPYNALVGVSSYAGSLDGDFDGTWGRTVNSVDSVLSDTDHLSERIGNIAGGVEFGLATAGVTKAALGTTGQLLMQSNTVRAAVVSTMLATSDFAPIADTAGQASQYVMQAGALVQTTADAADATAPVITQGSQVTEQVIRNAMNDAPLVSQQAGGVSLPRVQQYVDQLLAGDVAPAIKVDGNIIVDGNHRYIAGRVLGQEPAIQPWPGGRPAQVIPWTSIPISPEAW